jgi:hypothetical protein
MVRNEKLWAEIAAKLAELVDRDGVEFLATLDGLQAQLFLEVSIDDISGDAVLALRNNTIEDSAGAPVVAALVISKAVYRRMIREKETAVQSLRKRHGDKNWKRLVARSRPVEATDHIEILGARS